MKGLSDGTEAFSEKKKPEERIDGGKDGWMKG
jgi:hypothetical protein